jgi:hypothetical protein
MAFAQVSTLMGKMLGFERSVHSLERTDRRLAEEVAAFWEAQPVPTAEQGLHRRRQRGADAPGCPTGAHRRGPAG